MRLVFKVILSLLLLYLENDLLSQSKSAERDKAKGNIIDEQTGETVPFVHILNESKRKWYMADNNGQFKISADCGDTLVLSAIGYLGQVIIIDSAYFKNPQSVLLIPRQYEIGEVEVRAFRSYSAFRQSFITLEVPETDIDRVKQDLKVSLIKEAWDAYNESMAEKKLKNQGFGVSTTIDWSKPLPRNTKILTEREQFIIDRKFNRQLVQDLTKLEDDELTDFIGYCNFSNDYLLEANAYEIIVRIMEKFEEFKNIKPDGSYIHQNEIQQSNCLS